MPSRFYVTTPIYYINDVPHLGSAYTTIAADVVARYKKLRGFDVHFLTGTDEHGLKIQRVAEERNVTPGQLADEVAAVFRETWPKLGCEFDDFIRTTEERHKKHVRELWTRIERNGDIYLGAYEGLYCVGCEAYYTEKDLGQPGNVCPLHQRPVETVKEESYFFRLSRYQDRLLEFYRSHPTFVEPASRLNEVLRFVESGLEDLSVSRTTFSWGIPVPGDERHVMYVWFDALSNYLTALQGPVDRMRFWPASLHLVGKDILRFHAVFWPAFLMSAGYSNAELPERVYAHGFLTCGGQKMSKSLRNTVAPVALAEAFSPTVGVDTLRYCLMRAISFGQDGDFSIQDMLKRYGSELGNSLGNLLHRILPFAEQVPRKGLATDLETELMAAYKNGAALAAEAFDAYQPTRALDAIWTVVAAANLYVDRAAPWAAKKNDPARLETIVSSLLEVLGGVALMISPVLPTVAAAMREQLGSERYAPAIEIDQWPFSPPNRKPGEALRRGAPIFPRIEKDHEAALIARFSPAPAPPSEAPPEADKAPSPEPTREVSTSALGQVSFDTFASIDLRIGQVLSAERVKNKVKLLKLLVEVGEAKPRSIVAGIAAHYAPEELVSKRVVVLCNLPPREFAKGLVSEGMLLAADHGGGMALLAPDQAAAPGSRVR